MSQERQEEVLKTLEKMGLTKLDAQIYVFLGKRGSQKAKDIATYVKAPKQTLYRAIKDLQSRGIVTATLEHPSKFSAIPLEKVLDLFVKTKTEEVNRIQDGKEELLSDWEAIAINESGDKSPRFTVLEGKNCIYSRIKQMIEDTNKQLLVASTSPYLLKADKSGLLDAVLNQSSKTKPKFKFIVDLSQENLKANKLLLERIAKAGKNYEGRTPEFGMRISTKMVIRDNDEALLFIGSGTEKAVTDEDNLCLWTNCKSIVDSFSNVFDELWQNSITVEKKIAEIETGNPAPKISIINNAEEAKKNISRNFRKRKKRRNYFNLCQRSNRFAEKTITPEKMVRKRCINKNYGADNH